MALVKIKIDMSHYTDEEFIVAVQIIIAFMTGNTNFTTPSPTIPIVQTAQTAFILAYVKASKGGVLLTQAKNDARDALTTLVVTLAAYVQPLCTTILIAESSGFELVSTNRTKVGLLKKILLLLFKDGANSGSTEVSISKKIKNANSYIWMYTQGTGPLKVWITKTSSKGKIILRLLTPGQPLTVKCAGVGADDELVWSNEFTLDMVR
jgi:hypothetical protein